jgi:UDP-2,3-diacylglucosamine pyrophosphatase LpxH
VLNTWFNLIRQRLGFGYWSLCAHLKNKAKNAVQLVDNLERPVSAEAHRRKVDGGVFGHIHKAEVRMIRGVLDCNDGDWAESRTALIGQGDGGLEVVNWAEQRSLAMPETSSPDSRTA